ncbi:MAG TPA: hypothetical protein DCY88_33105 [Cyanobacteria bacterium UBA11372]|nr:hypothetical protein [Cyanobacteria bacterium UBA11372]
MHLQLAKRAIKVSAIALIALPITAHSTIAQHSPTTQPHINSPRSLTGQWVMASIDPDPKVRQKNGKYGISVTQNGNLLSIQPQIGIPLLGQLSGQQVRVSISPHQYILGDISNDANRVFLTISGASQPTAILIRVGSSGCPNRGNWTTTISSCNVSQQ